MKFKLHSPIHFQLYLNKLYYDTHFWGFTLAYQGKNGVRNLWTKE